MRQTTKVTDVVVKAKWIYALHVARSDLSEGTKAYYYRNPTPCKDCDTSHLCTG